MSRRQRMINLAIWQDDDFRQLPAIPKMLYMQLWTHPRLSYCGVVDWRPAKLAAMYPDLTKDAIEVAAECLEARLFAVVDHETEEVLIRSWARFDGLLKQPRMAVSFANAFADVASNDVRGVIVYELEKLRKSEPDLSGWGKSDLTDILDLPQIDPRTRALPDDPFGDGFTPSLGLVSPEFGPGLGVGLPRVSGSPTSTSTSTSSSRRSPEKPIPDSWEPNEKHRAAAREKNLDVEKTAEAFRNHAQTHDRRCRDWNAAFRNWILKAAPHQDSAPSYWRS